MNSDINALRQSIDKIEDELISLLNERAKYVLEIGKIKREQGFPVVDPGREELILNRVAEKNSGPVSNEFIVEVFKMIIEESVRLEIG